MKTDTTLTIEDLKALPLPELRRRYEELHGEPTACPNKTWLARRVNEALANQAAATPPTPEPAAEAQATAEELAPARDTGELKLSKLSVEELQALHAELVGRPTNSCNLSYLRWRVGQARKGKVPSGSRPPHRSDGPAPDFKVLPLRMEAPLVEAIDAARERLGLKSRMDLFRIALHAYFEANGETDVAAQITLAD
jgi:hypothetical protein